MNMPKPLDITTICNGAIPELFAELMEEVLENIADPSTNPETVRSITLKIDFKPTKDRHGAVTTCASRVKVAPVENVSTSVLFGKLDGKLRAYSTNPNQMGMFDPSNERKEAAPEEQKKVVTLSKA